MKLWEIIKGINDGDIQKGDKFKGLNIPFTMIIEYDGCDLVYNKIWSDYDRKTVTLSSGEINTEFEKIDKNKFVLINGDCETFKICPKCDAKIPSIMKHAFDNEWCPECGFNINKVSK